MHAGDGFGTLVVQVDPVRSAVAVSLPYQGVPAVCAILTTSATEDDGDQEQDSQNGPPDMDSDGVSECRGLCPMSRPCCDCWRLEAMY